MKRLNILRITDIKDNKLFVDLIDRNNIDDLKNEKDNNYKNSNIGKFIKHNNDEYINFINNIIKEKETKVKIVQNSNIQNDDNINLNKENNNSNNNINNENNKVNDNENNKNKMKDENNEIHNIVINDNNNIKDENNYIIINENNNNIIN